MKATLTICLCLLVLLAIVFAIPALPFLACFDAIAQLTKYADKRGWCGA